MKLRAVADRPYSADAIHIVNLNGGEIEFVPMRKTIKALGALFLLLVLPCRSSAQTSSLPSIDGVLARVSKNIQDFQDLLPDFVCTEKITSTRYEKNGLIAVKRVVDSTFTGLQKYDGNGHSYVELRTIEMVDGLPAYKGQDMPTLPFRYGGGFSSAVISTFTRESLESRTFKLAGTASIGAASTLLVEYATKNGQKKLMFESMGKKVVLKDTGKAWIDPASMQVLRLERHFLDFPNFEKFSTLIDYGETEIGGKVFWMPKIVRADAIDGTRKVPIAYLAEYSNCRRYTATLELKFEQ